MANFEITNPIYLVNKASSVDSLYGTYPSLESAIDALTTLALPGRQFAVQETGQPVKLYIWQGAGVDPTPAGGGEGDYIPLTGTEEGKPLTGKIEVDTSDGQTFFLHTGSTEYEALENGSYISLDEASVRQSVILDGYYAYQNILSDSINQYVSYYSDDSYLSHEYIASASEFSRNVMSNNGSYASNYSNNEFSTTVSSDNGGSTFMHTSNSFSLKVNDEAFLATEDADVVTKKFLSSVTTVINEDLDLIYSKVTGALSGTSTATINKLKTGGNLFIGLDAGAGMTDSTSTDAQTVEATVIGKNAGKAMSSTTIKGITFIGSEAGAGFNRGNGSTFIGYASGKNTGDVTLNSPFNTGIGAYSLANVYSASNAVAIGYYALSRPANNKKNTDLNANTIGIGAYVGYNAVALVEDVLIGYMSGYNLTNKSAYWGGNVAIGKCTYGGLNGSHTTQNKSVFIGDYSGGESKEGGRNVGIGAGTLQRVKGNNNVAIGSYFEAETSYGAGRELTGDNNVILGGRSGYGSGNNNFIVGYYKGTGMNNSNNNINILGCRAMNANNTIVLSHDYNGIVNGDVSIGALITGNRNTGKVGIGIQESQTTALVAPSHELEVNGEIGVRKGVVFKGTTGSTTLERNNSLMADNLVKLPNKSGTLAVEEDTVKVKYYDLPSATVLGKNTTRISLGLSTTDLSELKSLLNRLVSIDIHMVEGDFTAGTYTYSFFKHKSTFTDMRFISSNNDFVIEIENGGADYFIPGGSLVITYK